MGMRSTRSFMLLMMLPSSSGAKKGTVSGSCSAIVSEESGKGACEVEQCNECSCGGCSG